MKPTTWTILKLEHENQYEIEGPNTYDEVGHIVEKEVIEKSAYDKAVAALKRIKYHDGHRHSMDTDEIAAEALRELGESK